MSKGDSLAFVYGTQIDAPLGGAARKAEGDEVIKAIDMLHRWAGAICGLTLAVIGMSGALLVHRDVWISAPRTHDPHLQSSQNLIGAVETLMADPVHRPAAITFATPDFNLHELAYADGSGAYAAQSGEVVARWSNRWKRPELWLYDLHHQLLGGEFGEAVVGVLGVLGALFALSGAVLWWRSRKSFEFRLWPKALQRPAITRHHRNLGIVVAPLLLLSVVTGSLLVFRPLTAIFLGPSGPGVIEQELRAPRYPPTPLTAQPNWRAMMEAARGRFPEAEFRALSLPDRSGGLIRLRMRQPEEWLPNGRTFIWFTADSGTLIEARDARGLSVQSKAHSAIFPLHSGAVGGLPWRIALTLSGLALSLLGLLTSWSFWAAWVTSHQSKRRSASIARRSPR